MITMHYKIFTKVERKLISPKDWSKMLVSPINKKGNKLEPDNYTAISLILIVSKVLVKND